MYRPCVADRCLNFKQPLKHSLLGLQSLLPVNKENFTIVLVFPIILFPELRWGKLIGWKKMLHQTSNNFPEEQLQEGWQTLSNGLIRFSVCLVFSFMTEIVDSLFV